MNIKKVTDFLFVTGQIAIIFWVSLSYFVAVYATIVLGQPFPVEELSKQAMGAMVGFTGFKVAGNIFEHNDGGIFGTSTGKADNVEEIEGELL